MRLRSVITEDEMVSVFLQTEINSVRFEQQILALLHVEVIVGISPDFAQWGAHGTP
jgi:hypothetical protein